jgi:hypothetical protein
VSTVYSVLVEHVVYEWIVYEYALVEQGRTVAAPADSGAVQVLATSVVDGIQEHKVVTASQSKPSNVWI